MIPKIIHYCWFGRNKKNRLAKRCIKSWKRYCKGFEIVEWNEDNFSIEDAPLYVREAYEAKKWAFVTDYVRLYVLLHYGGIYMDTDVEILKPLDFFLCQSAFMSFEDDSHVQTGIMACEKENSLFLEFINAYDYMLFKKKDGSFNTTTNVSYITETFIKHGLKTDNSFQIIENVAVYPQEFFCPLNQNTMEIKKTENTVAIHWFSGSWYDEKAKEKREKYHHNLKWKKVRKKFGPWMTAPIGFLKRVLGQSKYEKLRRWIIELGEKKDGTV